jgi:hypothetical protein
MDDTSFFREQAERFEGQARTSIDPLVKSTLESLSSGLAAYANGLEERALESPNEDTEDRPQLIVEDETSLAVFDTGILNDDDWCAHDDAQPGVPVTKYCLFFTMLLTPSLGVTAWTILKHGTW